MIFRGYLGGKICRHNTCVKGENWVEKIWAKNLLVWGWDEGFEWPFYVMRSLHPKHVKIASSIFNSNHLQNPVSPFKENAISMFELLRGKPIIFFTSTCCVFWPANGCFACCTLVDMFFSRVLTYFSICISNPASCVGTYIFCTFFLFFHLWQKKMEKHVKTPKTWFQPANSMQRTHVLVEIHNINFLKLYKTCLEVDHFYVKEKER